MGEISDLKKTQKLEFPKGFLWGAATSAHQVEGNNTHSDWWNWEQKGGGTQPSSLACDHYHRFEEDFELAKSLGHNAHRLSIEWARIEPEEGQWDEKEIEHYQKVLKSLKGKDMQTFVSLFHVTLPFWFAQKGGFEKKQNIKYFKRFALVVVSRLNDKVDFWVTVNEPQAVPLAAYAVALWPPQKRDKLLALKVYLNLALAHRQVYKALKNEFPAAKIGAVVNMPALRFYGGEPLKEFVPSVVKKFVNRSFLKLTRGCHDFLGVNYYFFHEIKFKDLTLDTNDLDSEAIEKVMLLERSDLGWPIYPPGIYEVVMDLKKYKLPIYITENGVADAEDKHRERFIINHLQWLHQAIREGADVRGYLHWSLMDNFEWAFGFKPRFGLVEVDFKTQERKVRKSALTYAKICRENALMI